MRTPTIVMTGAVPWSGLTARPQHLARHLAERGWSVLFVDGPITWLSPFKQTALWSRALPAVPVYDVPVDGSGHLRVLSPVASLPFGNVARTLNRWNQSLLAHQIRSASPGPYVLLSMLPGSVDLIQSLHPLAVLYDCVDSHAEFHGFIKPATVTQMESDLVACSRAVFATAGRLLDRMAQQHPRVSWVPNAAQLEHFATAATTPEHPRLADIPTPRVGFIGGIGTWTDQTLIRDMAQARPDVQFVMIGPIETDVTSLSSLPNVHLTGPQPYAELPRWLAGFRATLSPFRVDDAVAQSVNPVKVYEYIAAGCEVIGTPIPEVQKLAHVVWLASDGPEAVAALDRILAGEQRLTEAERMVFVTSNSWAARTDQIEAALLESLPPSLLSM